MNDFETTYQRFVFDVLKNGEKRVTRAGPTRAAFGCTFSTDALARGVFPILTGRKMFYKPVVGELAAFLQGYLSLKSFKDLGCNYWDANAKAWSENKGLREEAMRVGRIYGAQWRHWTGLYGAVDQLSNLIRGIKSDPGSRRHLLTTYNPAELDQGCLPPCHLMSQYNVGNDRRISCIVYMRSVDLCLGLPSDIILYAVLLLLICQETGYGPGMLTFMLADTHIYENHIDPFHVYIQQAIYELPKWSLETFATTSVFTPASFELKDYIHGPKIDFPFNV